MGSRDILITAWAGSILIASILGVLLFGVDLSVVWLVEGFAELIGVLPSGWADGHMGWMLSAALILTGPLVISVLVVSWKQIFRVESLMARGESLSA